MPSSGWPGTTVHSTGWGLAPGNDVATRCTAPSGNEPDQETARTSVSASPDPAGSVSHTSADPSLANTGAPAQAVESGSTTTFSVPYTSTSPSRSAPSCWVPVGHLGSTPKVVHHSCPQPSVSSVRTTSTTSSGVLPGRTAISVTGPLTSTTSVAIAVPSGVIMCTPSTSA